MFKVNTKATRTKLLISLICLQCYLRSHSAHYIITTLNIFLLAWIFLICYTLCCGNFIENMVGSKFINVEPFTLQFCYDNVQLVQKNFQRNYIFFRMQLNVTSETMFNILENRSYNRSIRANAIADLTYGCSLIVLRT